MALYQPTNVIPSSYTKGTVDVNDTMEIAWQVNGNSAMTAFQIDFYLNDYASTYVTSTGKLTDNIPFVEENGEKKILGFYGTDRFGRPQFFTWNSKVSWEDKGFTNGNEYKYKITQWYRGGVDYYLQADIAITDIGAYYFSLIDGNGVTQYISFRYIGNFTQWTIRYNLETNQAYITVSGNERTFNSTKSTQPPTNTGVDTYENLGQALNEIGVIQNSFSVFITRSIPKLTIFSVDENYLNGVVMPPTFTSSIGYFHAEYSQVQGDPIRWIRWQVATATYNTQTEKWAIGDILQDTGDIYTPTLNYEFKGFFNGQQYAIRAIGESESGQECNSNPNTDGWIYFTINIENQGEYSGEFTVQCLNKENATLLAWEGVEVIPSAVSPQGYKPQISNGSVTLNGKNGTIDYSVTWNKESTNPMNFAPDWTAVWKGKIRLMTERQIISVSGTVSNQRLYNGEMYWYYSDTYTLTPSIDKILKIDVDVSSTANDVVYELIPQQTESGIRATIFLMTKTRYNSQGYPTRISAEITYILGEPTSPKGEIYALYSGANKIVSINQNSDSTTNRFTVTVNGTENIVLIQDVPTDVSFIISPTLLVTYFYGADGLIYQSSMPITYNQQALTSVSILGGDSGATVNSVSVYQGDGSNIISLYQNSDFEPVWNSEEYKLYMTANFNGNLEGGTGTATGTGFRVYRQEVGKSILTPIATVSSTTTSLKDYGIVSRKNYKYSLYAYDNNGAFMNAVESKKIIATDFVSYSLLVCDYDETNDEYHVRKQYLFKYNLGDGSVSNNNNPTLNANFTRFPTRMPSTQNYASGVLTGLIGVVYTVPALVEQIGNYKITTRPTLLDYFDDVELERELYDLSTAPYQLFLRDMKGRLRMIHTNSAISMTTNIKQQQQSISISFPWVEIGDASDVTIIQTPDDYGWNNDNQLLNVSLDVDVATGELYATYPFPYNGTKFYLTGAKNETLTAKTPLGITPAQFNFSETATQPDDGKLTATVKVNSEETK